MKCRPFSHNRQSGAALIVALIFLLLMTLLSTSSMRNSTMQERMAGNMRDWNIGFQGAEASLRFVETFLLTSNTYPEFDDTSGYYQVNSPDRPVWDGDSTSDGNGYLTYPFDVPGAAERPKYYIEELSSIKPAGTNSETGTPIEEIFYFRVTSVGFGGAVDASGIPLSSVVLSTVYRSR